VATPPAPIEEKPVEEKPVEAKASKPKPDANGARDEDPAPEKPAVTKTAKTDFAPLPAESADTPTHRSSNELYTPEPGQRFLQVAAEKRDSAEAVADVLTKAGFPAHVAAKPGDDKLFRVLVGPIKDNNDLSAKREALMKKGFTGMIPRTF
jgi:cell division septation protein DedD